MMDEREAEDLGFDAKLEMEREYTWDDIREFITADIIDQWESMEGHMSSYHMIGEAFLMISKAMREAGR